MNGCLQEGWLRDSGWLFGGGEEGELGTSWDGWLWKGTSSPFGKCQQYAVRAGMLSYLPLSWVLHLSGAGLSLQCEMRLGGFLPSGKILPDLLFLLLHYVCSESWRKFLLFLCLSGGMQDLCCPSAAALSSTSGVCLASCLAVVGRDIRHHMQRAEPLAHKWAGPGGLDVNTVSGRGGCRTSSEVLL